jgi:small subunit ribosomal protein S13
MARLVGVDLPRDKRLEIALTYIFGIGRTRCAEILAATGISRRPAHARTSPTTRSTPLRDYIEASIKVEGDLAS